MPEILLHRVPWGFKPADRPSEEAVKKVRVGRTIKAKWSQPRNVEHHRKWWALMALVAENWPGDPVTAEQVCEKVKLGIGHFDWIDAKLPGTNKPVKVPVTKSISFGKMDQAAFEKFYSAGVQFIQANLWPTLTDEEIRRQVEEFAG